MAHRPPLPLDFRTDGGLFKLYMCDMGLMSRMVGTELPMFTYDETYGMTDPGFSGAMAENYVLDEIVSQFGRPPRYWKGGRNEVDFVLQSGTSVVPVEVKSGTKVRASGLREYIDRYSPERAVVLSMNPPRSGDVTMLPLYLAWMLRNVVEGRYDRSGGA